MNRQEWELARIYAVRNGCKAFANPKIFFFNGRDLHKMLKHAKSNPENTQKTLSIPCASVPGLEGSQGNFILVWEPVLEAIAA